MRDGQLGSETFVSVYRSSVRFVATHYRIVVQRVGLDQRIALHGARLIARMVTGEPSSSHLGQLSLAVPPPTGAMSTGDVHCHRQGRKRPVLRSSWFYDKDC